MDKQFYRGAESGIPIPYPVGPQLDAWVYCEAKLLCENKDLSTVHFPCDYDSGLESEDNQISRAGTKTGLVLDRLMFG